MCAKKSYAEILKDVRASSPELSYRDAQKEAGRLNKMQVLPEEVKAVIIPEEDLKDHVPGETVLGSVGRGR